MLVHTVYRYLQSPGHIPSQRSSFSAHKDAQSPQNHRSMTKYIRDSNHCVAGNPACHTYNETAHFTFFQPFYGLICGAVPGIIQNNSPVQTIHIQVFQDTKRLVMFDLKPLIGGIYLPKTDKAYLFFLVFHHISLFLIFPTGDKVTHSCPQRIYSLFPWA